MLKWVGILVAFFIGAGILTTIVIDKLETNLRTEMIENATLRREVVELEEENKVFQEIFDCATLRTELGLIEEENNGTTAP